MATLGHIAIGIAAARVYRRGRPARWPILAAMAVWSVIALLPDADVIGYPLGVPYAAEWGHRGATHSLIFAAIVGLAVAAMSRRLRLPPVRTGLAALLVVASHPVLDMLTDGGLGCAILWPFDSARYFAPWNPIPVADNLQDLLSAHGAFVVLWELAAFGPLLIYALWPRSERGLKPHVDRYR